MLKYKMWAGSILITLAIINIFTVEPKAPSWVWGVALWIVGLVFVVDSWPTE